MNCLSPTSFPLQRVAAAAAKLHLLWSETSSVWVVPSVCRCCSSAPSVLSLLPPVSPTVVVLHLPFVGEPSQLIL